MKLDPGLKYTEEQMADIEKRLVSIYEEAEKDIESKMNSFNAKYKTKEARYRTQVETGKMTQEEFDRWKSGQVFQGKQWQAKKEEIAGVLHDSNKIASDMVNSKMFGVFAENANYIAYDLEHGAGVNFGFSLYDGNTVARLIKDEPNLLPKYTPKIGKDMNWNTKKITRQITLGVIEGESLDKISKRLASATASQNMNSMKTHARTLMTGAQNAGRVERIRQADNLGLEVLKEWMATLDSHTRDSHADIDGEQVPVDAKFSNGLSYPGEAGGDPAEVYNCRCTLVSELKKYPSKYERYDNIDGKRIDNMSYNEWKEAKSEDKKTTAKKTATRNAPTANNATKEKPVTKNEHVVVQGKDLTDTWERRKDEFDFEIDDIINAQGFDGLPQVVPAEEFDKYVKESNFIAQRTYVAPNSETVKAYQDQLYNGKWYVDCSDGGSIYGKGMYTASTNGTEVIKPMEAAAKSYGAGDKFISDNLIDSLSKEKWVKGDELYSLGKVEEANKVYNMGAIDFGKAYHPELMPASITETLTLSKDAKVISYVDLKSQMIKDGLGKADAGSYAALKGYDAIVAEKAGGAYGRDLDYTVVLNRTKVIIKGE